VPKQLNMIPYVDVDDVDTNELGDAEIMTHDNNPVVALNWADHDSFPATKARLEATYGPTIRQFRVVVVAGT